MVLILSIMLLNISPVFASDNHEVIKEETVYGILNADGHIEQVIVTEHVQKTGDTVVLNHNFKSIELLMDGVQMEEDNQTYRFTTEESDLYYKGIAENKLPVMTEITFVLDGQKMTSKDMAGKSGHLVMTINQSNQMKIEIENVDRDIYLPFETALVVPMNNQNFENVYVSSGKVIDDGKMKVLTAVLTPGLKESLDLDVEYLVDQVTIEADVTDFQLSNIYMTTICKLPDIDLSDYVTEFNNMTGKVDTFQEASHELEKGSQALEQGVMTYFQKQNDAFEGFNQFLSNNDKVLNGIIQYKQGLDAFSQGLNLYTSGVLQLVTGINALQTQFPDLLTGVEGITSNAKLLLKDQPQGQALVQGLEAISLNMSGVNEALIELNAGGQAIKEKTAELTSGSQELLQATTELAGGASQLLDKESVILDAMDQLSQGGEQVHQGSFNLFKGIEKFNQEGVDELVASINEGIERVEEFKSLYDELKVQVDHYDQFTGNNEDINESVLFILKTESIN